MRTIERTNQFKRQFKKVQSQPRNKDIDQLLVEVLAYLIEDQELPAKYRDHNLTGNFARCRECHLKPDLLLIYQKQDDTILLLLCTGSHSELFG